MNATEDVVEGTESITEPPEGGPWPRSRPLLWFVRSVLAAATLVILVVPFGAAWHFYSQQRTLTSQQQTTAVAEVSADELARWKALGATLPADAPPIVLCYHDVRPNSSDPYVVTPAQLDAQLTALEAAGFSTITSAQFVEYVRGGPTPPRAVYLTFDDGTGGLWTYADKILERHQAHAASFLISGRINTHRPYYLSWAEVAQMAASGRWDFQAHTHDLHARGQTGSGMPLGSLLTNRAWDPVTGHLESVAEYQRRISADFTALFADFSNHDLPRPALFAFPFSEITEPSNDAAAAEYVLALTRREFAMSFTNKTKTPAPTSRRTAAGQLTGRIEVNSATTPDYLLEKVISWTAVSPDADTPLSHPTRWKDWDGEQPTYLPPIAGSPTAPPAGDRQRFAMYAPHATVDWNNYTVSLDVSGLNTGQAGANVHVRVGSVAPVVVRISRFSVEVVDGVSGRVVSRTLVRPASTHRLEIAVSDTFTQVVVDDRHTLQVPSIAGPATAGGIALSIRIGDRRLDRSSFNHMTINKSAAAS